jgi:leucine dehydrogenase
MEELIKKWDGETVLSKYDSNSDTWLFIAIHSTSLGVATGGTRFKSYPEPNEALRDAMRLAEGMTYKWAGIDFPRGGGKAVLGLTREISNEEREKLLIRYGAWLNDLHGIFETGPDLGTTPDDMDIIRKQYPGVFGCTEAAGGQGDPGPYTALGVFYGILSSCKHAYGSKDLSGRSVLVQGAGSVGMPLIRYLLEAGCEVRLSEVDPDRISQVQSSFDLQYIDPQSVYDELCDVFAPCATGGILNSETIPRLNCTVVAGGANNQLEKPEHAEELKRKGILYAPDFIINAGGALYLVSMESMGWTEDEARREIQKIGETLTRIYSSADEHGIDTGKAAEQLAKERIQSVKPKT